jgi:protein involved in polysaccharide export with SLBB domain
MPLFKLTLFLAVLLCTTANAADPDSAPPQMNQESADGGGGVDTKNANVTNSLAPADSAANAQATAGKKVEASTASSENQDAQPIPDARTVWKPDQFQSFVESASGKRLEHFGHELFKQSPAKFAPLKDTPVPSDYLIGPGDELLVRLTGAVDLDSKVTVDRNGLIHLSRIGAIPVAGVRVAELESYLNGKIARLYKNFSLSASLGQLRSMQIYVMGHAQQPGAYVVSSLSTLVSALFASGGPSATGSLRRIKLMRNDSLVTEIDLYALLGQGSKTNDARLQSGDVIVIPQAGPRVALLGAYNRPAIYELRQDGETIDRVFGYGGDISVTALPELAMLERISSKAGGKRIVEQINLNRDRERFLLMDGDVLTLLPISMEISNAVTLRGHVVTPMRYPHQPDMRVRDLFPNLSVLQNTEYFQIKNGLVSYEHDYLRPPPAEGKGARPNLTQFLAGSVNWDYATIERLDRLTLKQELIPFNLRQAIVEGDPTQNLALTPGDIVTVYSTLDVGVPSAQQTRLVMLEGEVAVPGVYQVRPGETLRELVVRIGGLTPDAYLHGAKFVRESVRQEQQRLWDQNIEKLAADVERVGSRRIQEDADAGSVNATAVSIQAQRQLVERLRAIKPEGRISLEIPDSVNSLAHLPDIVLEQSDRFHVPHRPPFVTVLGQVYSPGSFMFQADGQVADYLRLAGGMSRQAKKREIHIVHANGTGSSGYQDGWFGSDILKRAVRPGDTIFVPEELDRFSWRKELKDWTSILYQFGLGAAALKSLTD